MKRKKDKKEIGIEEVENKINELKEKIENNNTSYNKKEESSKKSVFEIITIIVIIIIFCLLVGNVAFGKKKNNINTVQMDSELKTFIEQYNYILENYYKDVDKGELIESAISGMLSSLDEHSTFIDNDSNSFSVSLTGYYDGVGIGINNTSNGDIIITQVYPGTPAEEAGLKNGDIVIKINNEELKNTTSSELVEKIGKLNTMKLTIKRNGEELEVNLTKRRVVLQSVYKEMFDNNIGYIYVDIFALNTYQQFKEALESLENNNMTKLIIDLRNNTGGHLSTVENMISLFLDKHHVIYQIEDKNGVEKNYSKGNKDKTYPIVILQNNISASASEVMTSALKENLNAYIIGEVSYGKGTVQELINVNTLGQYKVTTKKWLTPNGNWINEIGIKPDLEVSISDPSEDSQLEAAVNYLNNLN